MLVIFLESKQDSWNMRDNGGSYSRLEIPSKDDLKQKNFEQFFLEKESLHQEV